MNVSFEPISNFQMFLAEGIEVDFGYNISGTLVPFCLFISVCTD